MKKEVILTENAALPKGPYSQAIRAGNFLFLSGGREHGTQKPVNY